MKAPWHHQQLYDQDDVRNLPVSVSFFVELHNPLLVNDITVSIFN